MKYNTSKKYRCPYCDFTGPRDRLVSHLSNEHENEIPEDFSAARVVFNIVNKKTHGICVVCKNKTEWNEDSWKYNRICNNPSCKKKLAESAHKNVYKVYKTTNLAANPEHQEKMLKGRKISGTYKFSDGTTKDYVGQNEKKCLEFMDNVMNIPSKDILTPGPTLKYEFNDKELFFITDIYYIPANLIIECKDGGSNPNNRPMEEYRNKQIAKEEMITSAGTYNYVRLTDNNFAQLLEVLADIKYQMIDDSDNNKKVIININEEVGGFPPAGANSIDCVLVQYGQNNVFTNDDDDTEGYGIILSLGIDTEMTILDGNNNRKVDIMDFLENRKFNLYNIDKNSVTVNIINEITQCNKVSPECIEFSYLGIPLTPIILDKVNEIKQNIEKYVNKLIKENGGKENV